METNTLGPTVHDLPETAREYLLKFGTVRLYRRGEEVQRRMVPPNRSSWLRSGRLRTVMFQADGTEQSVGWVMTDELFGVAPTLLRQPSRVSLLVDTPEASVLHFSREVLVDMMLEIPMARVGLAISLSRGIQQLHDVADLGGARTLVDKLRGLLSWWARRYGTPHQDGSVELAVTQADISCGVGASRQRVHMELRRFQELGEVDLAYRKLILCPAFFGRATHAQD